jgi:hypothetical protein
MNTSIIAIAVVSVLVLGGLAYYKWGAPGLGGVALGAFIVGVLFRRASSTPTPPVVTSALPIDPRLEAKLLVAEAQARASAEKQSVAATEAVVSLAETDDVDGWIAKHAEDVREGRIL